MDFECPECQSKTEYSSESEDVNTTSTIVCPSCQTLYDLDTKSKTITTTKSKFDKTNYKNKITGITNQLAYTRGAKYTVPCPHCKHIWEMKGIPSKSVHLCTKCYQYFGVDDVKIKINSKDSSYKTAFQVSKIYPNSIFDRDMDKMADLWKSKKSIVNR